MFKQTFWLFYWYGKVLIQTTFGNFAPLQNNKKRRRSKQRITFLTKENQHFLFLQVCPHYFYTLQKLLTSDFKYPKIYSSHPLLQHIPLPFIHNCGYGWRKNFKVYLESPFASSSIFIIWQLCPYNFNNMTTLLF